MCKAVYYIQNVSAICSVSTLTAMSLERYYAILHPVRSKYVCTVGRAKKVICILWIASLVLACPILYGREYHIVHGINREAIWCRKIWNSFAISVAYEIYMIYILLLVPVIIMTFAYVNICLELWHISSFQNRQQRRLTSSNGSNTDTDSSPYLVPRKSRDDNKSKKQVIKMLVAVIVIFIICWAPLQINNVLIGFEVLPDLHEGHHKHIREAFYIMAYANSSINPIIYTFMSKKFKETFKKTICACVLWRRGTSRSQTYRYATELRDEGSKTCHTSLVNHKNVIEMNSYGSQRSSSPSHV
ncbi:QRFP-like peptide receptor [Mytilus californianus]|uniref:QRFP-like peptide receptor n=1 Tax=Mytilus californianus TaxID=6549 RepID=UPI002248751F|nr:QRFP-like peptide receptor [Mytilus californianus]